MATSHSSSLAVTREWIDGNCIQRLPPLLSSSQENYVNLDFAEELYGTILDVFSKFWHSLAGRFTTLNNRQVREVLARLRLWGGDFQDGRLACVLAQSDELRDTTLDLLCQIGKIIIKLLRGNSESAHFDLPEEVENLRSLLAKAKSITKQPHDSNGMFEDEDDQIIPEVISAGLEKCVAKHQPPEHSHKCNRSNSPGWRRGPDGAQRVCNACELDCANLERKTSPHGSTGTSVSHITMGTRKGPTASSCNEAEPSSDDEEPDMVESLGFHVGCLMDLVPSMEGCLAHLQAVKRHPAAPVRAPFSVSELARPFVQNISDKFQRADICLIERLGESNWQRFITIRARMQQTLCKTEPITEVAEETKPITVFKHAPQSVFMPLSLFHDSGLGSSVPTVRAYPASTASHTSFVSSVATDGLSALRVPPTPKEVQAGQPFRCEICGHLLSKIKNRVDWKIHIFADLQPYICTFEPCEKKLVKFPTRKMWAEHEFTEHRVLRSWCCPECSEGFSAAHDLEFHLRLLHNKAFTAAQLPMVLSAAETRRSLSIKTQECPLCRIVPGASKRNFVKHVGRHLEAIALATLPREINDGSEQGSVASSDVSEPLPDLGLPVLSPSPPFLVPRDFCHRTSLSGRNRELKQLDQKLFKEPRANRTASVLIHGEPGSGKRELVERYIQLNRTKFTGGVFWINYRKIVEVHHVLRSIASEYVTGYDPGPDVALDALVGAVRTWFESFDNWLIVLNDLLPVWGGVGRPGQSNSLIFSPCREHCSLIYISSSDRVQSSDLPLEPSTLEVAPLGDIRHPSPELKPARSPPGNDQTSSAELGTIAEDSIHSWTYTTRPYPCKQPECRRLLGFTSVNGLRHHQRMVHMAPLFEMSHPNVLPEMSSPSSGTTPPESYTPSKAQGETKRESFEKGFGSIGKESRRGVSFEEESSLETDGRFEKSLFGVRLPSSRNGMSSSNELKESKEPRSPSPPLTGLRRSARKAQVKRQAESRSILSDNTPGLLESTTTTTLEKIQRRQRPLPPIRHPTHGSRALPPALSHVKSETQVDEDDITRCVCGQPHFPMPLNPRFDAAIQCDSCQVWQHCACVGIFSDAAAPDEYFCEICRGDLHVLATDHNGYKISNYTYPQYNTLTASEFEDHLKNDEDIDGSCTQKFRIPQPSPYWTVSEQSSFRGLVTQYGTDFSKISQVLKTRTRIMVRDRYLREVRLGNIDLEQLAHRANQPTPDTSSEAKDLKAQNEDKEPRFCYCNDHAYGQMVACDDDDCTLKWYHLDCLGMAEPPEGNHTPSLFLDSFSRDRS